MRLILRAAPVLTATVICCGVIIKSPVAAQVFTEPTKPAAKPRTIPSRTTTSPPRRNTNSPQLRQAATADRAPAPPTFADPQAYCAANPSSSGPAPDDLKAIPKWLSAGWKLASNNLQSTSQFAMQWKCSGGKVLACGSPLGHDWCAKSENFNEPTLEMVAYCRDNQKGSIPREITGNTVPVWICKRRKPHISGYRSDVDQDGYLANTWLDVTALSPANMAGAVPRTYIARWNIPIKVGFISSMVKSGNLVVSGRENELVTTFAAMQIKGGGLGEPVGTTVYYGENSLNQVRATGCVADLILTGSAMTSITVVERYRPGKTGCRSPERFMLQENQGQLLVNWMRDGKTKPKRSEWVQAYH